MGHATVPRSVPGVFRYEKGSEYWSSFYHRECPPEQEDKQLSCGVLGEAFYIGADGVVAPCQGMCDCHFGKTFPTLKDHPLRELLTDSDYVKWNYATVGNVRRGNNECRKCEFIERCAGGCRSAALQAGDNYYGVGQKGRLAVTHYHFTVVVGHS